MAIRTPAPPGRRLSQRSHSGCCGLYGSLWLRIHYPSTQLDLRSPLAGGRISLSRTTLPQLARVGPLLHPPWLLINLALGSNTASIHTDTHSLPRTPSYIHTHPHHTTPLLLLASIHSPPPPSSHHDHRIPPRCRAARPLNASSSCVTHRQSTSEYSDAPPNSGRRHATISHQQSEHQRLTCSVFSDWSSTQSTANTH